MLWREIREFTAGMWLASAAAHALAAVAAPFLLDPGWLLTGVTLYCIAAAVAETLIACLVTARGSRQPAD